MADLKMKSDKYIFKKKLSLRRKSRRRLFYESVFLFILSLLLLYINNLIPNKNLLLQDLPNNLNKTSLLIFDLFLNLYEIFLVVFIYLSWIIALILFIGVFFRLFKILKRKPNQTVYK